MKKKILVLALCAAMIMSVTACGRTSSRQSLSKSTDNSTTGSITTGSIAAGSGSTASTENAGSTPASADASTADGTAAGKSASALSSAVAAGSDVTIESGTVLLDQNGIKITANNLTQDSIWGVGISVLIENNTAQNVDIQLGSLIVNNYMITNAFSASVAAGKKSNETIDLYSSKLEDAGINTIADIVLSFNVIDDSTYQTIFSSEETELKTSAYGTVDQKALDDGTELYNQDGIHIVGKYLENDTFWGAGVLMYVENNCGSNVVVQCDNMSINGFMVTPYFSCTVNNGRMALDDITIMSNDLEKNNIDKVETVELVFNILNADTYETIKTTDPITFSVT